MFTVATFTLDSGDTALRRLGTVFAFKKFIFYQRCVALLIYTAHKLTD